VNAEERGGFRLIAPRLAEYRLNESFFEFADRLIQIDMTLDHFSDKRFQLLFHNFSFELGPGFL